MRIVDNADGQRGFEILVGGGLGRTPHIAKVIREFVTYEHLLSYLEAILRVYNRYGRRDNKYKARIKIQVAEWGVPKFRDAVEAEWALNQGLGHAGDPRGGRADQDSVRAPGIRSPCPTKTPHWRGTPCPKTESLLGL